MPENNLSGAARPWTRWLVVIQLVWAGLAMLAVAGSKFSLLPWRPSLLTVAAAVVGMSLIGSFALLIMLQSFIKKRSGLARSCLLAVLLSVLPLGGVLYFGLQGADVPPIHDITTDTENPPLFLVARTLRTKQENSVEYGGESVARLQLAGYPHIRPLQSTLAPGAAYRRSLQAAEILGWQITASDEAGGRIEAMVESLLFGFTDDIVVRITPTGAGSRIDLRSASRVGVSDLGVNARRIDKFFVTFQDVAD